CMHGPWRTHSACCVETRLDARWSGVEPAFSVPPCVEKSLDAARMSACATSELIAQFSDSIRQGFWTNDGGIVFHGSARAGKVDGGFGYARCAREGPFHGADAVGAGHSANRKVESFGRHTIMMRQGDPANRMIFGNLELARRIEAAEAAFSRECSGQPGSATL